MSDLVEIVNRDTIMLERIAVPIMATPGAFAVGVAAGAKACGALVAAAGVGSAIANAIK